MGFSLNTGTLHSKVVLTFGLFALLFAVEGAVVVFFWKGVYSNSYQAELALQSQIKAQQTAMHLTNFLQGRKDVLPEITVHANETAHLFKILKEGGLWNGNTIQPATRLQLLSLDRAHEAWNKYSESLTVLTTREVWKDSVFTANSPDSSDSLQETSSQVLKIASPEVIRARAQIDGQWILVSSRLEEFLHDVQSSLEENRSALIYAIITIVLIDIIVLGFLYYLIRKHFFQPLSLLKEATAGRTHAVIQSQGEIGQLGQEINKIVDQFSKTSDFVMKIGEGKLDERYETDGQASGSDKLAIALSNMQTKLKSINDEDQRRRWANEGITRFVEIIRSGNDDLHALGDRIISALVQYTNSNQGGLYIVEEEEDRKQLELVSLFAFNTKKYEQQKLKPGEGLVGQCFLEAATIFLTEIPEDYIRITSGLGGANPKSILIVPLKVDKEIYGIVELASFNVYQPHETAFVEKLSETIASSLASVKNNQKTRKLLDDFRLQAEQMKAQEEEMRQNMEELTATQEEMTRKEKDYILKIKELEEKNTTHKPGDDWAVAEQVERTLRTNLEALEIAQEELQKKAKKS